MGNIMNPILQEDLETVVNDACIEWDKLKNSTILITGATGLIGSLLVKAFTYYNKVKNGNITILAMVRNADKAKEIFSTYINSYGLQLLVHDINTSIQTDYKIDYIIHGASITASKMMVANPIETIFTAIDGTRNILDLATHKKVKSVVYISSMEVYGITDPNKEKIFENDLGYIDNLSVRSSYSEGKRCCELICSSYYNELCVPVKIARLAQTFGAGVAKSENRIFAQFAKSVLNKKNIELHTTGESVGNYCYTADVVRGLLCILTRGNNGEAYTVVNEETTIKIRDMAEMVARDIAGDKIAVDFDIPKNIMEYGYAPDVTMRLSNDKIKKIGWNPNYGLKDMYLRMIEGWK